MRKMMLVEFAYSSSVAVACRCMVAFPEDYKTLVPRLLSDTMMAIGASFISHINLAIGEAVPETKALAKGCSSIF